MKHLPLMSALFALSTFSSITHANEENHNTLSDFSVTLGLGIADHTIDSSGGYEEESATEFAQSLAVNYHFSPNFSISAAYTNYGEAELFSLTEYMWIDYTDVRVDSTVSSDTAAMSLYGTYQTDQTANGWTFGANLGLTSWQTDINIDYEFPQYNFSETETMSDESGVALIGGLNAAYAVSEHLSLSLSASWFVSELDMDLIEGEQIDMQHAFYALNATYRFQLVYIRL